MVSFYAGCSPHLSWHRSQHMFQLKVHREIQWSHLPFLCRWRDKLGSFFLKSFQLNLNKNETKKKTQKELFFIILKLEISYFSFSTIFHTPDLSQPPLHPKTFLTLPSPVMVPTKLTGHLSLSAIFWTRPWSWALIRIALLSWYSAPQSSRTLRVGSPSWNLEAWIRAPAGSAISFSTLPVRQEHWFEIWIYIIFKGQQDFKHFFWELINQTKDILNPPFHCLFTIVHIHYLLLQYITYM